jgi:hypothetical protein
MALLMKTVGPKHTIMVGLFFEMLQLMWYGFGSQPWMMWSAGVLASVSSITYPAISAFVSMHADADKQVRHIVVNSSVSHSIQQKYRFTYLVPYRG